MSHVEPEPHDVSLMMLERASDQGLAWVEVDGELLVWSDVSGELHRLDPVAASIFELCAGRVRLAEVVSQLAGAYGVPPEQIEADVHACVRRFIDTGLVSARPS